jgi:hypothetical protein
VRHLPGRRLQDLRRFRHDLEDVQPLQRKRHGEGLMEYRLFDPADPPEWLDPEWWRDRPHCDHLGSPTGAHVARLRAAAEVVVRLFMREVDAVTSAVDLGAGDGALLERIRSQGGDIVEACWGYDIITADVEYAQNERRVNVTQANVFTDFYDHDGVPVELADVVVLTEVLEHMADPHGFLALLAARPEVRYVVASSPRNETPEQHEWNHAWAWDPDGYREMFVAAGFEAREFQPVEWSQLWLFERRVELTDEEAAAALEDERENTLLRRAADGVNA